MSALAKAGLSALGALRSRLPAARVPGIKFTRKVPTPQPPSIPFRDIPEPAAIRPRDFDKPREVVIPRVTDKLDPVTGLPVIEDMSYTVKPMPREAFDEFDNLFSNDRENTIFALFSEIENVENFDRLYLVTELMRRYRPQMHPRQARVLEQSLEEAAQRLGVPPRVGKMDMFSYMVPETSTAPVSSRTFGSGKSLLDEVNSLGKKVNSKTADPIEIVAAMNKYDRGPGGGIFGRAVAQGSAGDAADQRLIQNQINYWRRQALNKTELDENAFTGLRGLRYTDDMPESEVFSRTAAAMRSATTEDEVAMILAQSRGRLVSPNYTDVLDDLAGRVVLDIAGDIPVSAELSGLGRPVPGAPFFMGRMQSVASVDEATRAAQIQSVQAKLKEAGLPQLPDNLVNPPRRVSPSISEDPFAPVPPSRGANIIPAPYKASPFEEFGSATSGRTGYGPIFRGVENPFDAIKAARIKKGEQGVGLIKKSFLTKGNKNQKEWAKLAEGRMEQLLSNNPAVRAHAAHRMRIAVSQDLVEPSLLAEMRRIVRQGVRAPRKPRTIPEIEYTDITTGLRATESTPATSFSAVRGRPVPRLRS